MLLKIAIGSAIILANLGIQVWAAAMLIRRYRRKAERAPDSIRSSRDIVVLAEVMLFLFLGHILQFATWALLFVQLGEFPDFETAFYHSTVNFTSLGYGDIVMSEQWRLLGALEAANGVLMFGLTAGLVLTVMQGLFRRHGDVGLFPHPRERGGGD